MKILRSVTRRGFSMGTAGWFTVLRPNTWFAATRLPSGFRYRSSHSAGTLATGGAERHEAVVAPRIMLLSKQDRGLVHMGLVLLAAAAITSALLWWIMHP